MVTKQAAPAKPTEAPETENTQEQEGADQAQDQQAPAPVTLDQVEALLNQREELILQKAKRTSRDQIRTGLQNYTAAVEASKKAGHPIPEDVQAATRQQIINDGFVAEEEGTQPESGKGMTDAQWNSYVLGQVDAAFRKAGMAVQPGDPEFAAFHKVLTTQGIPLADVVLAAREASETKKVRVTSDADKANARTNRGGGHHVPPNDISNINDSATLYELGEQRLREGKK